jgi:hypothetical protein
MRNKEYNRSDQNIFNHFQLLYLKLFEIRAFLGQIGCAYSLGWDRMSFDFLVGAKNMSTQASKVRWRVRDAKFS